jgi:hypothetical protein
MIREKSKEARELRGRVLRKYQDKFIETQNQDAARDWVLECFDNEGLTERRLNNILARRAEFGNPAVSAYTDARMMVFVDKLERDIDERREEIDSRLEELDGKGDTDWVEIEQTDTTGGKFDGSTTKKRPVWDVKLELSDQKIKNLERYFNAIKALRGSQPLIQIANSVIHTDETAQDMIERIRQLEKMQKIQHGVTSEATETGIIQET